MCAGLKNRKRPCNNWVLFDRSKTHTLSSPAILSDLKLLIREIPDFPKPGILFYDITTLLKNGGGLRQTIDGLKQPYEGTGIDIVVGIEARGFIFAPAIAYALGAGFVPVRKPKKLPGQRAQVTYELEYGTDTLEIHEDAIFNGCRVLIVDDLLATGGTAKAAADLVGQLGGTVAGIAVAIELTFLGARAKLAGYDVFSLLQYDK
jgi:adenine phosphoribosyltransferase